MKFTSSQIKKSREEHEYIYIAIDQETKYPLHFHIGVRSTLDTNIFLNGIFSLSNNINIIHSDAYKPYISYMKNVGGVYHTTDKFNTTHIESLNSILRHRLSFMNRRTRNNPKSLDNFKLILNLFFYRYILRL